MKWRHHRILSTDFENKVAWKTDAFFTLLSTNGRGARDMPTRDGGKHDKIGAEKLRLFRASLPSHVSRSLRPLHTYLRSPKKREKIALFLQAK